VFDRVFAGVSSCRTFLSIDDVVFPQVFRRRCLPPEFPRPPLRFRAGYRRQCFSPIKPEFYFLDRSSTIDAPSPLHLTISFFPPCFVATFVPPSHFPSYAGRSASACLALLSEGGVFSFFLKADRVSFRPWSPSPSSVAQAPVVDRSIVPGSSQALALQQLHLSRYVARSSPLVPGHYLTAFWSRLGFYGHVFPLS